MDATPEKTASPPPAAPAPPPPVSAAPTTPTPPAAAAAPLAINKSALVVVFLVVFIDLLGFGIVLPLLPVFADTYIAQLTSGPMLTGLILGLLMSSFSLMQFLFAPFWGRISDRIGRRPILLLGLAGSALFYALLGVGASLPPDTMAGTALVVFFIARCGAGIAGATIATAQAVIADCTPPDQRKHGMALIGAAFGIGFTFGPLLGFLALRFFPDHHQAVGYTAAGLSLVALILGIRKLPETRRFDEAPTMPRRAVNLSAFPVMARDRLIGPIVLTFFLATLGFAAFETTLALLLKDVMGLTLDHLLLIFAFIGLMLVLTQGYLYRKLAKRLSEIAFMTIGLILMGVGVGMLGWVCSLAVNAPLAIAPVWTATETPGLGLWHLLLPALTVSVVGFAFLTPSAQALISRRTDASQQGEVLGVNQSASAMARIIGPIFGLVLYKLTSDHMLPYIFGAILLFLMLPLMPRIKHGETAPAV